MTSISQQYLDLLTLTKNYLMANFEPSDDIVTDPDTWDYFTAMKPQLIQEQQPTVATLRPQMTRAVSRAPIRSTPPKAPISRTPPQTVERSPAVPSAMEKSKNTQEAKKGLQLLARPTSQEIDLSELRKLLRTVAPALKIIDEIPNGQHAIPTNAKLLLVIGERAPSALGFIEALAKAIEIVYGPCGITFETTAAPGIPLIEIPDPTLYLQEPLRKADLWNEITRTLG